MKKAILVVVVLVLVGEAIHVKYGRIRPTIYQCVITPEIKKWMDERPGKTSARAKGIMSPEVARIAQSPSPAGS